MTGIGYVIFCSQNIKDKKREKQIKKTETITII